MPLQQSLTKQVLSVSARLPVWLHMIPAGPLRVCWFNIRLCAVWMRPAYMSSGFNCCFGSDRPADASSCFQTLAFRHLSTNLFIFGLVLFYAVLHALWKIVMGWLLLWLFCLRHCCVAYDGWVRRKRLRLTSKLFLIGWLFMLVILDAASENINAARRSDVFLSQYLL